MSCLAWQGPGPAESWKGVCPSKLSMVCSMPVPHVPVRICRAPPQASALSGRRVQETSCARRGQGSQGCAWQVVHLYNELRKLMPTIMQLTYAPRGGTPSGIPTARSHQARLQGVQGQQQAQQPAGLVQLAEGITRARLRDLPQLASFVAAQQQAMAAWGGADSVITAQGFPLVSTCCQPPALRAAACSCSPAHRVARSRGSAHRTMYAPWMALHLPDTRSAPFLVCVRPAGRLCVSQRPGSRRSSANRLWLQARWLKMGEAAAVHERLSQLGDQMRTWTPVSASFAEEAQRIEQFLDGARAQIAALAAQVLPWHAFGGVRLRSFYQSSGALITGHQPG